MEEQGKQVSFFFGFRVFRVFRGGTSMEREGRQQDNKDKKVWNTEDFGCMDPQAQCHFHVTTSYCDCINQGRASQAAGASGASEASLAGEECDYTGPRRSRGYCDNFFDGLTSQAGRSERSERGQPGC